MPAAKPTFRIEPDADRNLVRIAYLGHVTAADMAACAAAMAKHLPALRPGFTAVTDLSALDSMDLDCVGHLTKIMDLSRAAGVATVVRIVPDTAKDIGFNILSIVHYRRGVKIITCETLAEAERALKA